MPQSTANNTYWIDMQPVGRRIEVEAGTTLLEAARIAGVGLVSLCAGEGWCESCQIRLMEGELSPTTLLEQAEISEADLLKGYRLACQSEPLSNVKIEIPPYSLSTPQRLQLEGQEDVVSLEPAILPVDVQVEAPSLDDLRSDSTRLKDALSAPALQTLEISSPVLSDLSERLRANRWSVRVAQRDAEIVAVLPAGTCLYGIAADIGTTKLAVYLLNLESGETVAKSGAMNPQIAYGEDVISRISYTREHADGRRQLQDKLIETLNEIILNLCSQHAISPDQIVEAVFVGNTAMHHLFAGLPVEQLGLSPCVPAVSDPLELRARDLGLHMAPGAVVNLLPNIAGYVGADHVAMVLASGIWQSEQITIGVDIGTNTEITLSKHGQMLSCSAASGPAFEGAHIQNGMRAAAGAIERVQLVDDQVHIYTIEDQLPTGICGSGILDLVAEMRKSSVIDEKGAMQTSHPLVRHTNRLPEFVLASPEKTAHGQEITFTRKDVNEIQLAKAAIRTGIDILIEMAGIQAEDVDEFIIAGAFGSYINVSSAIRVGMFPNLPLERFVQVGNAAGIGAKQALLSISRRRLANQIAKRSQYIELTTHPAFQKKFLQAMYL